MFKYKQHLGNRFPDIWQEGHQGGWQSTKLCKKKKKITIPHQHLSNLGKIPHSVVKTTILQYKIKISAKLQGK